MSNKSNPTVATMGIDIGEKLVPVVGLDRHGAIVLRQKWLRGQVEARLAHMPACLIGMEACVGAHHLSRKLQSHGHDARLMLAKYVRPYEGAEERLPRCGSDRRGGRAPDDEIRRHQDGGPARLAGAAPGARAVGQPAHPHHQSNSCLPVGARSCGAPGAALLRTELPIILATRSDVLSPRMTRIIEDLVGDWRRLDERIEGLSNEIEAVAHQDPACERLMTVPDIGPIISSAMVAAIGNGAVFAKGRDFGAWLGLVPKQISTGDRTTSVRYRGAVIATCAHCSCRRLGSC